MRGSAAPRHRCSRRAPPARPGSPHALPRPETGLGIILRQWLNGIGEAVPLQLPPLQVPFVYFPPLPHPVWPNVPLAQFFEPPNPIPDAPAQHW